MRKRIIAFIVDDLIIGILSLPFALFFDTGQTIVVAAVAGILYLSYMESSPRHSSLGKIMAGLMVTSANNGDISPLDGWSRNILKFLPLLLVGIFYDTGIDTIFAIVQLGLLGVPFFNKNHLAVHDLIAGTQVTGRQLAIKNERY